MSFQQALSGLAGAATTLDTISNNIANAGTVGFKQSVIQFADLYASSLSSGATGQVGMGSSVSSVTQKFTQGNMRSTNNPLDVAMNGNTVMGVSAPNGELAFTRRGDLRVSASGVLEIFRDGSLKLNGAFKQTSYAWQAPSRGAK